MDRAGISKQEVATAAAAKANHRGAFKSVGWLATWAPGDYCISIVAPILI